MKGLRLPSGGHHLLFYESLSIVPLVAAICKVPLHENKKIDTFIARTYHTRFSIAVYLG